MSKPNSFWRKAREIFSYPARHLNRCDQPKRTRFMYERVEEFPEVYEPFKIYLISEKDNLWGGRFLCPCGCGDVISLNLSKKYRPRWRIKENNDGSASIMPSIRRQEGCRSHFVIYKGRIDWYNSDYSEYPK